MRKITAIIALFLILSVVVISGCASNDNQTSSNITYTDTKQTPAQDTQNNTQTNPEPETEPEPEPQSQPEPVSAATYYIGSVNSDVFHIPGCHYVNRIKESNKISFSSRDSAISSGYRPCEVCNP